MTVPDDAAVRVVNMTDHLVGYTVPELNVNRSFDAYEMKKVPAREVRALNYKHGGQILLNDYLCVKNDELRNEFGIPTDLIEYDYTEKDIDRILLEASEDELKDTLDFAPDGIIELLLSRALKLKIPDVNKREIIQEFTGVDINKRITLQEEEEQALKYENKVEDKPEEEVPKRRRRVAVKK